jgi:hypothetical protein
MRTRFRATPGRLGYRGRALKLVVPGALVLLGVIFVQAGSASPPSSGNKVVDICLQYSGSPDCSTSGQDSVLPGAATPTLTLQIKNASSSGSTLGSVNFDAPTTLPIDASTLAPSVAPAGNVSLVSKSGTGGQLQIRNLNLAIGGTATVTFAVDTPCAGTGIVWPAPATKQSNNFLGTGNDFQLGTTTGMTSDIAAGGCHVAFYNQPADTKVGSNIETGVGSTGDPIKVGLYDSSNHLLQSCPASVADCTATIAASAGSPDAGILSGGSTPVTFAYDSGANGLIAPFSSLSISGVTHFPESFTLTASGLGTSAASHAFNIVYETGSCTGGSCTLGTLDHPVTLGGGGGAVYITTSTGFTFLELNPLDPIASSTPPPAGCLNFKGTGAEGFVETDGRTSSDANMTITYYVPQKLISARYGKNVGQQFIPICAGAKPVDSSTAVAQNCTASTTGWTDNVLGGPDGLFTGTYSRAVCDTADGYVWGILPSFQDVSKMSADELHDLGPYVHDWNSLTINGATYRYFTIVVPGNWDMQGHG